MTIQDIVRPVRSIAAVICRVREAINVTRVSTFFDVYMIARPGNRLVTSRHPRYKFINSRCDAVGDGTECLM